MLDGSGAVQQFAGEVGERVEEPPRIGVGERRSDGGSLVEGNGLVVTSERDVEHGGQDASLGPEQPVDGGHGNRRGLGDGVDRGGRISPLYEQVLCCGDDRGFRGAGLRLAAGVVVAAPLDTLTHIGESSTLV